MEATVDVAASVVENPDEDEHHDVGAYPLSDQFVLVLRR